MTAEQCMLRCMTNPHTWIRNVRDNKNMRTLQISYNPLQYMPWAIYISTRGVTLYLTAEEFCDALRKELSYYDT